MVDDGCGPSEYLGIRLMGKHKNETRWERDAKLTNWTHPQIERCMNERSMS